MNRAKIKHQIASLRNDLMLASKVMNKGVPNAEYLYDCRDAANKLSNVWVNIKSELLNKVANKKPALYVCMFCSHDAWNIFKLIEKQSDFCYETCEKYNFSSWLGLEVIMNFNESDYYVKRFTIDNGRMIFFSDFYDLVCYFRKEIDDYLDGEYGEPDEKTIKTLDTILNIKY